MDTEERSKLSTNQKALKINLDQMFYGTFAEIGAGQEVARWFFKVGAAAGTIAKSISAYDMAVSDAIYGHSKRYVSRERLQGMLDHEHALNLERLQSTRRDSTAFFAFANTVAARNYQGTNECHGWMGVKYQAHPRDDNSQIILHVRMLDPENDLQADTLGIVGVNLLYGAFFLHHKPEELLESLLDNLSTKRIEIDMIEFSGIEYRYVDNRVMSLKLVQLGLSGAAMFGPSGEVLQPSEVLRKRPILVERGSFRPVTKVNIDMINCAKERFGAEPEVESGQVVELMEITMQEPAGQGKIDLTDFLARADLLAAVGKIVLISDFFEYYRLAAYLARYTHRAHCGDDGHVQPSGSFQGRILLGARRRHPGSFGQALHQGLADLRVSAARSGYGRTDHRAEFEDARRLAAICTATWSTAAASSSSIISTKASCTSSRATYCAGSRTTTHRGKRWSPRKLLT